MRIRKFSQIDGICVHHSASNNPNHDDISVIKAWHLERGFDEVGYNDFITTDGSIQKGRHLGYYTAAVKGHNGHLISICLSGNGAFTALQFIKLYELLEFYIQKFNINPDNIHGHNYYAKTDCPGLEISQAFVERMKRKYN